MKHEPTKNSPPASEVIAHLGQNYDGIQEYDNPLPGWWKGVFWLTIVFSLLYLAFFHTGAPGRSVQEQFLAGLAENTRKQYAQIGDLVADEDTMVKYMGKPDWVNVGGSIFKANCVSCHGADGGGKVGPNLCDDQYKSVKQLTDIVKVISEGLAGGAMPAWATRLGHKNDVILVSVYVASLRGTKPASPKAPDGTTIEPWPAIKVEEPEPAKSVGK